MWRLVEKHHINSILIVGDAMGRPLIEALEEIEAAGEQLDLSSFFSLSSSAAVFSPTVKDRFLERFPNLILTDSIGATESGFNGILTVGKDDTAMKGGGPTVSPGVDTVVLDDDLNFVAAGSGVIGKVARGGNIPLGYYKDEEKTAKTFVIAADGRRYAIPGDFATVEDDGRITLLGRGSVCINTGGEKVYPEEVEQVAQGARRRVRCRSSSASPTSGGASGSARWSRSARATPSTPRRSGVHARRSLAGYKVPRSIQQVDQVRRSPSGKPDYPWALELAADEPSPT